MGITLNTKHSKSFIDDGQFKDNINHAIKSLKLLQSKEGKGNDYLGWMNLPSEIDTALIKQINATIQKVKDQSEVLVIIGIGGSYLGAKAVISALTSRYHNQFCTSEGLPEIYFAGTDISGTEINDLIRVIGKRDFSVNVISKSGTTTEPALAFRVLKALLETKYNTEELRSRIIATTDANRGALRKLSQSLQLESYVIPDDVGGRFSVFTPVGLIPIAAAGIDLQELLKGARDAEKELNKTTEDNIAIQYAALRNSHYQNGKHIEILANYEPRLAFIAAWWKQLFGESEGKDGKGIFPASVDFTCDLHSMGQYIQDGPRHLMETVLNVTQMPEDMSIPSTESDLDNLNYLASKTFNYVNSKALEGTLQAHVSGNVPNIIIDLPQLTPYYIGYLLYFFEISCGISAYMIDVNPFDQPGVESYKKNMFSLLGKPN